MLTNVSQAIAADVRNALVDIVRGKIGVDNAEGCYTPEIALKILVYGVDESIIPAPAVCPSSIILYFIMCRTLRERQKAGHVVPWNTEDREEHGRHLNCLSLLIWSAMDARFYFKAMQPHPHEITRAEKLRRAEMAAERMKVWRETGYKTPSISTDWWYWPPAISL